VYVHITHTHAQAQAHTYTPTNCLYSLITAKTGSRLGTCFAYDDFNLGAYHYQPAFESVLVFLSLLSTPLADYCRPKKEGKKPPHHPHHNKARILTIRDQFLVSESTRHRSFLALAPATRLQYFPAPPTSPLPNYAQSHFACLAFSRPGSHSAALFSTSPPISLFPFLY
jgi:hypothetical protein